MGIFHSHPWSPIVRLTAWDQSHLCAAVISVSYSPPGCCSLMPGKGCSSRCPANFLRSKPGRATGVSALSHS
eukprot:3155984-Alexandrium_andersonii.AAC.1